MQYHPPKRERTDFMLRLDKHGGHWHPVAQTGWGAGDQQVARLELMQRIMVVSEPWVENWDGAQAVLQAQ